MKDGKVVEPLPLDWRTPLPMPALAASAKKPLPQTQLAREILENLAKFPHCILLTKVGQFYEVRDLA